MSFFYVDDQMPFHPKMVAAGNAAVGLWARVGGICKQHPTGGLVQRATAAGMGSKAEIDALLRVGLWHGPGTFCDSSDCPASSAPIPSDQYAFHDWYAIPGNGPAEWEKQHRDAGRASARKRKADQRQREAERRGETTPTRHATSHAVTSGVTHGVSHGESHAPVTGPPSPYPLTNDTHVPHVPNREASTTDDVTPAVTALAGLGITDFGRIKLAIAKHTGRAVDDQVAITVIADLLAKAPDLTAIRSKQGYVLSSIEKSWPEIQKLIDERIAA